MQRDLLKLPDDFEGNKRALVQTPPAAAGTTDSKTAPKPPATPKPTKRAPLTRRPQPSQAALAAQEQYRAEQRRKCSQTIAEALNAPVKPNARKRKAT